jgi:arylsulfatase A-like enzyme
MNILLVLSDTFRYDNLSCYGPTAVKTPHLDRFAQEAFIFDNAYLGSFPTIPHRLDIMSGRFSFIDHEWCPLPKDTVTVQQILSASGFTTMMIADNPHLLESGFNYDRGFEAFEWIRGQETDHWRTDPKHVPLPQGGKCRSLFILKTYLRNRAWWRSEEDRFCARTIREACAWLERNQDQEKFFLYVDLFDPHEPWDAPQNYLDLYDPGYAGDELMYPQYNFWREFLTEEELDHVRALYRAEATMVDHWFGVLLDKLDELGMNEDTAVIFASDHGYLFGEHGMTGKALLTEIGDAMYYEAIPMYNEIRRTPLLIRVPGQEGGKHIPALVQAPDLMPTLLELAGLVATETVAGRAQIQALQCGVFYTEDWHFRPETIHGKSLVPLMRGETTKHRDIAVCSNTIIHHTPILAKCAIVTEDGWCLHYAGHYPQQGSGAKMFISKLIDPSLARIPPSPALYYLPDDPQESRDLLESNRQLADEIHQRYVAWLTELGTPDEHLAGRCSFP